ncbi:Vacuolar protein sorting-associated protein 51 like [Cercospora zeina]
MSIASPRPSVTLSSRRTSIDTTASTTSRTTGQAAERGSLRRNRAALRDYYNLKTTSLLTTQESSTPVAPATPALDPDQESELDKPGFEPEQYVQNLLTTEDLYGVLRIEASLVSDIRNLDGEKKALVYDNYSKLITATDTIKAMREKMDPMMPGTSTLGPAIGHIAETAAGLKREMREASAGGEVARVEERRKQQECVRWVLGSAERLRELKRDGRDEDAQDEWDKVSRVLEAWKGVKGVEGVKRACLEALEVGEEG